jgi:hypothetical protein
MNLAPILLLVYNRPETTKTLVNCLLAQPNINQFEIYVFSDGAKSEYDFDKILEVRQIIEGLNICKNLSKNYSEINIGLAESVIKGINTVFESHEKIIVLEDDLEISPFFFNYMNYYLSYYQNIEKVGTIQGFQFPIKVNWKDPVFLDEFVNCWGWGTWKNRWIHFEPNGSKLLNELNERNLTYEFNGKNSYPFMVLLEDQVNGRVNSWAIRWYASLFLKGYVHLYPNKSLVINNGLDGNGTHGEKEWFVQTLANEEFQLVNPLPTVNLKARNSVIKYRKQIRFKLKLSNLRKRILINILNPLMKSLKLHGQGSI